MSEVIVIGAGICGSSLARAAVAAGYPVMLISDDSRPRESLAAVAVLRRAWHKGEERGYVDRSMALYREWGVPVISGAVVTNYRFPGIVRLDPDWHMIAPEGPLCTPDVRGHAELSDEGVDVGTTRYPASNVLWATGRYGPHTGGISYGVTWVSDDPADALVSPESLRVHHIAPYKTVVAGVVGGRARYGSSSAATDVKAISAAHGLMEIGIREGIVRPSRSWYPILGRRVRHAPFATLGGMHRTGYALAPALAEIAVSMIGENRHERCRR